MRCVTGNNLQQKCAFPNSFEKVKSGGEQKLKDWGEADGVES
jgi:hypothetical protein